MTIRQALQYSFAVLKEISNSPALDAEILLSYVLKKNRAFLFTYPEKKLTLSQEKNFKNLLARRKKHEPIAYIVGRKEFYGLDFFVNCRVLIPRPETEELVKNIIDYVQDTRYQIRDTVICDVGTGSGCVAIALAKHLPCAKIWACDISKSALKIAKINAKTHRVSKHIKFVCSDLFSKIPHKIKFDVIVANLPYLSQKQYQNVQPEIKKYEPRLALIGGKTGMEIYAKLLQQSKNHLKSGGKIFLENYHQI